MSLKDDLLKQLETVDGESLKPHQERDALVFVGPQLDITDVGVAFANDDKACVEEWLKSGYIWKCTESDISNGSLTPEKSYQYLILQPFVLAKTVATQ